MEDDELSVMEPASSTDSLSRKRKALDPVEENTQTLSKRKCTAESSSDDDILQGLSFACKIISEEQTVNVYDVSFF